MGEVEEVVVGEGRQLRELLETFGVIDGHNVAVHLDLKIGFSCNVNVVN